MALRCVVCCLAQLNANEDTDGDDVAASRKTPATSGDNDRGNGWPLAVGVHFSLPTQFGHEFQRRAGIGRKLGEPLRRRETGSDANSQQ